MLQIFKAWPLAIVLVVSACSGTMQGAIRGTGEPVRFAYQQGLDSDTLSAVIGDEAFQGKAVMQGQRAISATTWSGDAIFGTSSTGDAMAVLLGSRGSTLSCQLQYADASGFTTSGGVGMCRHSDGRVIDVVW